MARFIINVLDSFGVGEMPDACVFRPSGQVANTSRHILEKIPDLKIPNLTRLGLMNVLGCEIGAQKFSKDANFGRAALCHDGADSFLGHQEIAGTIPKRPLIQPFNEVIDTVKAHLEGLGFRVYKKRCENSSAFILVVNESCTVGDNLETEPGQVYNITACLDLVDFEYVKRLGMAVREVVFVSRVIAFGGKNVSLDDLFLASRVVDNFYAGVDAPKSGVYKCGYKVVHLGYGVALESQAPTILAKNGTYVATLGKSADIIEASGATKIFGVDSGKLYERLIDEVVRHEDGFFCMTIQETDLFGHAQDVFKYGACLEVCDEWLGKLLALLNEDDILVVMADHGNDPTIGSAYHTREYVPLLIYYPKASGVNVGERLTLADVAATATDFFNVERPMHGTSFLPELQGK